MRKVSQNSREGGDEICMERALEALLVGLGKPRIEKMIQSAHVLSPGRRPGSSCGLQYVPVDETVKADQGFGQAIPPCSRRVVRLEPTSAGPPTPLALL
jgi:hypothetical protein